MNSNNISTSLYILIFTFILISNTMAISDGDKEKSIENFPDLKEFSDLQVEFQKEKGSVRLVALLSASCGYCIKGFRYMRKILDEIPDERLKMYVLWEPMLSGDTKKLSYKMSKKAKDPRMVYQAWDEDRISGKAWTKVMTNGDDRWYATGPAWDVYYLYGGDAEWKKDEPGLPGYWEHQGAGSSELVLNYDRLKDKVLEFLAKLDEKQNGKVVQKRS